MEIFKRLVAVRDGLRASSCGQPLLARLAALEKVAEAARILEHYDSSPSDCDRVEEALRLAIAELAQLGTKEKL